MANLQKHGINPKLISVITGKPLAEIPAKPTPTKLPGKYGHLVAKHVDKYPRSYAQHRQKLTCTLCGYKGTYDIGLALADPKKVHKMSSQSDGADSSPITDVFQFSGYFRCRQCNGAGQWSFPRYTEMKLQFGILAALMAEKTINESTRFAIGGFALADG